MTRAGRRSPRTRAAARAPMSPPSSGTRRARATTRLPFAIWNRASTPTSFSCAEKPNSFRQEHLARDGRDLFAQRGRVALAVGMDAVAQDDDRGLTLRVEPERRAGEAGMAI